MSRRELTPPAGRTGQLPREVSCPSGPCLAPAVAALPETDQPDGQDTSLGSCPVRPAEARIEVAIAYLRRGLPTFALACLEGREPSPMFCRRTPPPLPAEAGGW